MSEITVKDFCLHCGEKTVVWFENDEGVFEFRDCLHCSKTFGDLSWRNKLWEVARVLKPAPEEETGE